ncbi:hypothetical protein VMCG_08039 [Cytospora schulzeri]|uniref:LITAF domain-containing protein n=1 Tax=Cytospora schulzeri TaxID=448051 RepID=A0A423VRU5_9PEZI|nr:hypothetical protein VMCG_08039 [Valsa malicola]
MDNAKPETEQQKAAEEGQMMVSTTEPPQENSSPVTQPDTEKQPATSSNSSAKGQGDPKLSTEDQAESGTAPAEQLPKVSFPRLRSSTPPTTDGQFGVVSNNGQLVCEFKSDDVSKTPPPEEKIIGSSSSDSEPKTLGGSVSPPPQASDRIEFTPVSNPSGNNTVSTLELLVDHNSYPEVYIAEDQYAPPQLPPRRTHPKDRGSSFSTSGNFSTKTGYLENNHMSLRNPVDVPLVTPIHLLGDQSDTVDCPFCMRRVETIVKKKASQMTHILGTVCLFTTFIGTPVPYCCDWKHNIEHHCTNCKRKIAHRKYDAKEFEPLGTDPELKEVSRFEAADVRGKRR